MNRLAALAALTISLALLAIFLLALQAKQAQCQGFCPPIDCYGAGDCGDCFCIQDAYPDPGYCVSIE